MLALGVDRMVYISIKDAVVIKISFIAYARSMSCLLYKHSAVISRAAVTPAVLTPFLFRYATTSWAFSLNFYPNSTSASIEHVTG